VAKVDLRVLPQRRPQRAARVVTAMILDRAAPRKAPRTLESAAFARHARRASRARSSRTRMARVRVPLSFVLVRGSWSASPGAVPPLQITAALHVAVLGRDALGSD